jgi:hypothetical protein
VIAPLIKVHSAAALHVERTFYGRVSEGASVARR